MYTRPFLYRLQEVEELVEEWTPEPLTRPLSAADQADLAAVPVIAGPNGPKPKLANGKTVTNLASYNWTGLAGNEHIKERAIETLRKYGCGTCGPTGFYGFIGKLGHCVRSQLIPSRRSRGFGERNCRLPWS